MGKFFASLKSSHALRWLLIWGVVILLVIVLIRYISEKHAAASGITTSGSGLDMTGAGMDSSGGSGGSGGSSTNINISITEALSQFFGRNRGTNIHPVPASQSGAGVVGGSGHVIAPAPGPVGHPGVGGVPAQHQPPGGFRTMPPVRQSPPAHRQPPGAKPPVRQSPPAHRQPPGAKPPVHTPPGIQYKPPQRF